MKKHAARSSRVQSYYCFIEWVDESVYFFAFLVDFFFIAFFLAAICKSPPDPFEIHNQRALTYVSV